jgi:hypothetical protein
MRYFHVLESTPLAEHLEFVSFGYPMAWMANPVGDHFVSSADHYYVVFVIETRDKAAVTSPC